jgi:TM2 domain-containing membrane protein YozV
MMEIKCPECGKFYPASQGLCACGAAQPRPPRIPCPDGSCTGTIGKDGKCRTCGLGIDQTDMRSCPYCAEPIKQTAVKCRHCHEYLDASIRQKQPAKNRKIAALLALFLGGIGAHKFYLNSPGWGIVYLLLSWTPLPYVLGVIEGLGFLMSSDQDFAKHTRRPTPKT